jgi:hypothetical protein
MAAGVVDPAFQIGRQFLYNPLPVTDFPDTIVPGVGRIYDTPIGPMKSVTTVLKDLPDDDPEWREKWAKRVGEDEANRVTSRGATRGTRVHNMVERYILGDPRFADGEMPSNKHFFKMLRPIIDAGVGTVYGVEVPLYSARLKTAGRSDLVCGFRGYNTVMDWKNSNNTWSKGRLKKALIQSATYATMVEDTYHINIPWITVVVVLENGDPQVERHPTDDYREWVERVFARREFSLTST